MSNKTIQAIESEFMKSAKPLPDFRPGDTVVVQVKVKEGERVRLQSFEGVVIARRNRGYNSSFTVRKISHGVGVERVFQSFSPTVDSVEVKRRGQVRRAKLYYMRELSGRAARIKEKLTAKSNNNNNGDNSIEVAENTAELPEQNTEQKNEQAQGNNSTDHSNSVKKEDNKDSE